MKGISIVEGFLTTRDRFLRVLMARLARFDIINGEMKRLSIVAVLLLLVAGLSHSAAESINVVSIGTMTRFYSPSAVFRDVILKSEYAIKGENMDRLCLGRELPDYTVRYADKGWCKVADVFTVADTGVCAATLTLGDGAAWRIELLKGASGRTEFAVKPLNALCGAREIRMIEEDDVAKVFVRCDGGLAYVRAPRQLGSSAARGVPLGEPSGT